jgi:hypothetical protein
MYGVHHRYTAGKTPVRKKHIRIAFGFRDMVNVCKNCESYQNVCTKCHTGSFTMFTLDLINTFTEKWAYA